MATTELGAVLQHVRGLAAHRPSDERTDGELVRAFLTHNDQAAFETVVRRHGSMVLNLCRRRLANLQDAEDAFQATFLLLARRPASIRKRESLAGWLHGVAYRMAAHIRRAAARRRTYEQQAGPPRPAAPALSTEWQEIQAVLDEEIGRLPESYREPFVLCCLEHKSGAEAADRLGKTEGAVR